MTGLPLLQRSDLLCRLAPASLTPPRRPRAGEQYRFHFDMAKCIGCKCCVVACNEQNGNPGHLHWRWVEELEGGAFPFTRRAHVSLACNHCLEPSCLTGCPVEAYTKDGATGIVRHDPDQCIGCQYCVWNCAYGAPQYNAERGVVGKCDMCYHRLAEGRAPACVSACPQEAISIEVVNIEEWRSHSAEPASPTTRLSRRLDLPVDAAVVSPPRAKAEPVPWSLVTLLVASQLAAGAFFAMLAVGGSRSGALAALVALAVAMAAAPLHLGRPIHAWRAFRGWRHSWLSREALASVAFGLAALSAVWWPGGATTAVAALVGLAAVTCSARIYMVEARPAWNTWRTPADFYLTAAVLGLLTIAALEPLGDWWRAAVAVAGLAQLVQSTWTPLSWRVVAHQVLLVAGSVVLPLAGASEVAALLVALAAEAAGRALFFAGGLPAQLVPGLSMERRAA
jgi:DMSO reductase iron-sulfur subunit